MDRAWQATVHGGCKESDKTEHTHAQSYLLKLHTWTDLDVFTLNEVSQTEKHKYHAIAAIHGSKIRLLMNLSTEQSHRYRKHTYGYQGLREGQIGGLQVTYVYYYI